MKAAFVLLSGGLDSSTCLYIAKEQMAKVGGIVKAVSMDYGQRHTVELEYAQRLCYLNGIEHTILDITNFVGNNMLTDATIALPDVDYADIKGISPTYVPFRNGFMLSRLAAYAQEYVNAEILKLGADTDGKNNQSLVEDLVTLYFGAHTEDALNWAYPDCTPEFIGAMANAIYIGTYRTVRLSTPLMSISKAQIVEWGTKLGVPYDMTWSCYKGDETHCGTCPTCRARKSAFIKAGVTDPTEYAA